MRQTALFLFLGALFLAAFSPPGLAEELPVDVGDRITVAVSGETELSRTYVVDQDGTITLALVGKVPVKGLTLAQVRDALTKGIKRFVRDPQVSVEFMQRAQITVGITGMVTKPGAVTLKKGSRLLDGLALAEGLTLDADPTQVRLQRRGEPAPRTIDLSRLDKDSSLNLELKDGDAVLVPRIPMNIVRVLGAVNKPGEVMRKDAVTLLEAVLAAGGLTADAEKKTVQVLKKGEAKPTLVNLDDVLSGSAENIRLVDGDVVTVPGVPRIGVKVFGLVARPGESQLKRGATVLEALTAAGGFAMDADRSAVLLTDAEGEVRRLNLEKVDSVDGATKLTEGSLLHVPQQAMRRYAVSGGVNEPGIFSFPTDPAQKVFLTDALASAKGMVDRAKKKMILVVRKDPAGGKPILQQIDFEALLKKKDPAANIEIMVGDVVYVDVEPERERKRSVVERVLGIAGAVFGF